MKGAQVMDRVHTWHVHSPRPIPSTSKTSRKRESLPYPLFPLQTMPPQILGQPEWNASTTPYGLQSPKSNRASCKSPSCVSHDLPRDFIHFCPSSLPSPEFACVRLGLVAVMGHTVSTASSTRFSTHHKEYPEPLYLTLYTVCFLALKKTLLCVLTLISLVCHPGELRGSLLDTAVICPISTCSLPSISLWYLVKVIFSWKSSALSVRAV